MWKLGKRELPLGIQFGGGSDWFCLNHKFIDYIINSKDPMLNKLMIFFNYTILPSEVN
jgi:protein xylosyltransferase